MTCQHCGFPLTPADGERATHSTRWRCDLMRRAARHVDVFAVDAAELAALADDLHDLAAALAAAPIPTTA